MRRWSWSLVASTLMLAACAGQTVPIAPAPATPALSMTVSDAESMSDALPTLMTSLPEVDLNNFGPAPELTNAVWLNVDHPLRLADLRGRVVLIDMWTFG